MSTELRFVIHGPLCSNNANKYPAWDEKRMRKTKAARDDARRIREIASVAAVTQGWVIPQAAAVTINAYGSGLDADNSSKVVWDSLKRIAWADDKDVMTQHVERLWDDEGERYEVIVTPCEDRRPGRKSKPRVGRSFSQLRSGDVLSFAERDEVLKKVARR